jgi:signal transduction histidine kinase
VSVRIRSILVRYGLAGGTFAVLIAVIGLARRFLGISLDTTLFIILTMVAAAWYGGRGPGLFVAILFEATIDYFAGWPKDPMRAALVVFNRFLLFGIVVFFASARRNAERSLRAQQAKLEEMLGRERAAREQAETANRLKDEFLATVSHELRTPLNALLGWAAMLNRHNADEKTARQAAVAIERSARSQAQIVDDILDMSRIITGGLRLGRKTIPLAPVVEEAVEAMRVAATAKQISLQLWLDKRLVVLGDPDRLRQVVWNLVSNAIKFTSSGGRIDVRLEASGDEAELQVCDTGAGIRADFFPSLFQRFRQADATMTREHGGLGLGLAIVHELVELHGGTVTAASDGEGKGSTFTVRLPLAEAQQERLALL